MATYTYNPDGLRRSKHVLLTLEQRYIWSGDSMVYECELLYPANGTVYVYGINLISAKKYSVSAIFYIYNAHGDVVQLVDGNGTIIQTYNYDAFGVEYDVDGEDDNSFRYAGQYYDTETGTYYLRARYYNPVNGRFTQQDTWEYIKQNDPLSLNLYNYCRNNPILFIDINGHWPKLSTILAVVAVVAVVVAVVAVAVVAAPVAAAAVAGGTAALAGGGTAALGAGLSARAVATATAVAVTATKVAATAMAATAVAYAAEEAIATVDITIFPASDSVAAGDNVISDPIASTEIGSNVTEYREHDSNKSPSNRNKHEEGKTRKQRDNRGEKGDKRRTPNPNKRHDPQHQKNNKIIV